MSHVLAYSGSKNSGSRRVHPDSPMQNWVPFPQELLNHPDVRHHHFALLLTLVALTKRRAGDVPVRTRLCTQTVGSFTGQRQNHVSEYLGHLETMGLIQLEREGRTPIGFTWADHLQPALMRQGLFVQVPKAVAYDPSLTPVQKRVYAALWWGLFWFGQKEDRFVADRLHDDGIHGEVRRRPKRRDRLPWERGVVVSQATILPEWTGMSARSVNTHLRKLEEARLIERRPGDGFKGMSRFMFVPLEVRYAYLTVDSLDEIRGEVPLYRRHPLVEERYQRWAATGVLPRWVYDVEITWDATGGDWSIPSLTVELAPYLVAS